jgi:nucleoside-diphosphate-sugar epimerase
MIAGQTAPEPEVVIQSRDSQGRQNIYLPAITRARTELGLDIRVPLREAIRRTLAFYK